MSLYRMNRSLAITLGVTLASLAMSGCSGCQENDFGRKKPAAVPTISTDVGEDVPPITTDGVVAFETGEKAKLTHLVFESSSTMESNRYKSEFLVSIQSTPESCARLKVRPTSGLSTEITDEDFASDAAGASVCFNDASTESRQTDTSLTGPENFHKLRFRDEAGPFNSSAYLLTGPRAALCSGRLFRMPRTIGGTKLAVPKTGRLMAIGTKVRVWIDEEYSQFVCNGSTPNLDSIASVAFGPLVQMGQVSSLWRDKLWLSQAERIASEMDKIATSLTKTYGAVSDIDSSGFVEIFISPDVNREHFVPFEVAQIDQFRANDVYRPEDLALYNSETNPTSNEGEVIYLWAPDPAGIYSYGTYPSSNSLVTNYAKGFMSAQLMTLVIANEKMIVQKKPMESRWLVQSLSGMAASYYGGNDFPVPAIVQYLTSRSNLISLTGDPTGYVSSLYASTAGDEAQGMRYLFGWYMHHRLCGANVTPCAKLADLIDSELRGKENVVAKFGATFPELLRHFGLTLSVNLLDDVDAALALWDVDPLPDGYPTKPIKFTGLKEVWASTVPLTQEVDNDGTLLSSDQSDRTVAGPLPDRDGLLFKVLSTDRELDFKMAPDALAFVLVTSLVESETDATALFGKGLSVAFVPAGDRDSDLRQIHFEKVAEGASWDMRPENLTDAAGLASTTYAIEPSHGSEDYSVTGARRVWVAGSIENFKINVEGSFESVGDSDAYVMKFMPCEHLEAGAEKVACEAKNWEGVAQVVIRDSAQSELEPMLLVTSTDRTLFRGHSALATRDALDPDFEGSTERVSMLCKSKMWTVGDVAPVDGAEYELCGTGGVTGKPYFDQALTAQTDNVYGLSGTQYAHIWDNYLFMGPAGYPYSTLNTMTYPDPPECEGFRCYLGVESNRQFLNFAFFKKAERRYYDYYPLTLSGADTSINLPDTPVALSDALISALSIVKNAPAGGYDDATEQTEAEACATVCGYTLDECKSATINSGAQARCRAWLDVKNYIAVCATPGMCTALDDLTSETTDSDNWLSRSRYFTIGKTPTTVETFYRPVRPRALSGYCAGEGNQETDHPYTTVVGAQCRVYEEDMPDATDIREQINTTANRFIHDSCGTSIVGVNVDACTDQLSFKLETDPKDGYVFHYFSDSYTGQRMRQRDMPIASPVMHLLSKAERQQSVIFRVPGTGSTVTLIVGGRKKSEGAYVIQTFIRDYLEL